MSRGRTAGNRGQGSNWCHKPKRLRILARDGWRCVWCGREVWTPHGHDPDLRATMDHVIPRSAGGTHDAQNLITACMFHNRMRGDRPALKYADDLARDAAINPRAALEQILRRLLVALTTPFARTVRKCKMQTEPQSIAVSGH